MILLMGASIGFQLSNENKEIEYQQYHQQLQRL